MPNHVHLILVPSDADGLRRALAAVHRRYAGIVHARRRRTGHFWQRRFDAAVMDEAHLAAALRYVSLNPVRARLVERPQDWRWASTRAHLSGKHDGITARALSRNASPTLPIFLPARRRQIYSHACAPPKASAAPLGDDRFLARIERLTARRLRPGKRGPKAGQRKGI
jgi:putative transposase